MLRRQSMDLPRIYRCFYAGLLLLPAVGRAEEPPFDHKVEVYRSAEDDLAAFTIRLEQPFLAEEFETSNYLRLRADDDRAYLIYPKETRFQQKHAEFYGRLRGEGKTTLKLSYETISENIDGSRRVEVREGVIEVEIPAKPRETDIGAREIFLNWARQQNAYFIQQLEYYPTETFFQYCLLQSKARYGVAPPPFTSAAPKLDVETELYEVFTGSLAIQETLQRQALAGANRPGDHNIHISQLQPPALSSLDYEEKLKELTEQGAEPHVHAVSRLIPADQYFVHFQSISAMDQLLDLTSQWGDNLLRLYTLQAQDNRIRTRMEEQLCLRRTPLMQLFADEVVAELAVTGGDPFMAEGTDVSLIFALNNADAFEAESAAWLEQTRQQRPEMLSREFNYRGHRVQAHYTNDRSISCFIVRHDQYIVYSNSHRAARRIIDVAVAPDESLAESLDYQYITALFPPQAGPKHGYLFVSEAAIRRLVGPAAKISQKRRRECFNHLVMLNNASLLFRWEYGRSPESLSELIQGRFVDPKKIICPHGGAYAFDADSDTCTCSLHNRLRYLTPNAELTVLQVSQQEAEEYNRYKQRYQAFWQQMFDPIAIRLTADDKTRLEACILPLANSSWYRDLRTMVDPSPQRS